MIVKLSMKPLRKFVAKEDGAALPEFALTIVLFLVLFFAVLDFGRMAWQRVVAEKAVQQAARIATVRPYACSGLNIPQFNREGTNSGGYAFGTACDTGGGDVCVSAGPFSCQGNTTNATVNEIWNQISPMMPKGITAQNLWFTYTYDKNIGFLGGPFSPVVTVELKSTDGTTGMPFSFVSRLVALAGVVSGQSGDLGDSAVTLTIQSTSLPGEDLAHGTDG